MAEQTSFIEEIPFHLSPDMMNDFPRFVVVALYHRGDCRWWKVIGGFSSIEGARKNADRLKNGWVVKRIYELSADSLGWKDGGQ